MPNKYYDGIDHNITDREDAAAGANPPDTGPNGGQRGGTRGKVKMSSPNWGLHGAPTQPRDRSYGTKEVYSYAKHEGLSSKRAVRPGKVERVMHEFKEGELHSGSKHGPVVKGRKQAVAIAMSESGQSYKK